MVKRLLNAVESQIYAMDRFRRMNKEQILEEMVRKDPNFSMEKVQNILDEIDRKANIDDRYTVLYNLTYKYWRVFRVAKEYLKEKKEGIKHVFNIDYSDLYVYFNPVKALKATFYRNISSNNMGSIHYMFNSKHTNKYCLLPPAVWELINRTYATVELTADEAVPKLFKGICNEKINMAKFFEVINKWDGKSTTESFNKELMSSYLAAGNWLEILALANEKKLSARLEHNYLSIKEMLNEQNKIIRTIDDKDFDIDLKKVNLDDAIYKKALDKLANRRPFNRSVNNKIDAANVAMTYDLTKDTDNGTYYRFISHSKHVSEAFNDIKLKQIERDEVNIACCPQLVSTLSLIENNQIEGIDKDDMQGINVYLDECIDNLEKMHRYLRDLKYIRNAYSLERETLQLGYTFESTFSNISKPIHEYLRSSAKFKEKVYPSFIEHIMDINAGVKATEINYDAPFKEDIYALKTLFKDQVRYKKLMNEVFNSIYADAEKTLKLYEDRFLTDDIRTVMERIRESMDTT
jgi:hypothetical protein